MDFIRHTVTLQITAPAHADNFKPSSWDWGELLELPSDMIQILDVSTDELVTVDDEQV